MISYVKGILKDKYDNQATILSGNIGYFVYLNDDSKLIGGEVEVYTYMHVRENEISLWGFYDKDKLKIFKALLSVSGIGPKTAQILVESKGPAAIINAIASSDSDSLKVSGVGAKTAQKIVLELKGKVEDLMINITNLTNVSTNNLMRNEVLNALSSLGYRESDVARLVDEVMSLDETQSVQDIIKKVLVRI